MNTIKPAYSDKKFNVDNYDKWTVQRRKINSSSYWEVIFKDLDYKESKRKRDTKNRGIERDKYIFRIYPQKKV